jgi:ABC-type Na+ efflux pump permease subunit
MRYLRMVLLTLLAGFAFIAWLANDHRDAQLLFLAAILVAVWIRA